MTRALILAATLFAATALAQTTRDQPVAMGNLGVHYNFRKIISTDADPLTATANGPIWCQASMNGVNLPIANATFIRYKDSQRRRFIPVLNFTQNKASLKIGEVVVENMGKYRCDIDLLESEDRQKTVFGNLFVYSSPFFHSNGSMNMRAHETDENLVLADPLYAAEGADFTIHCPATGWPQPNISWYKNNELLKDTDRIRIGINETTLTILKVNADDKAKYMCTATNTYPTLLDYDLKQHEASLEQELHIGGPYGWILPLLVILVTLLLLFIIIYACAACKRYQHDNYNVAKREKLLRTPSPASSAASTKKYELVSSA